MAFLTSTEPVFLNEYVSHLKHAGFRIMSFYTKGNRMLDSDTIGRRAVKLARSYLSFA